MVETFIIDWPVHLLLGLVFGVLAPQGDPWRSRALKLGLVTSVAFLGTALFSYFVVPDWMWSYYLNPDEVSWSVPLISLGFLFVFVVGFAASLGLRTAATSLVWAAAAGCVVLEITLIALTWDRYRMVGSLNEWRAGEAHTLFSIDPTGPVRTIGWLGPAFGVILAVCLWGAIRNRRAAASSR